MKVKKILFVTLVLMAALFAGCTFRNIDNDVLLAQDEIDGLKMALDDEYKAEATYAKVIEQFGDVTPFTNIINAEQKHSSRLIVLFNQYNIDVPQNSYTGTISNFDSIQQACEAGVNAEIENIEMYDDLIANSNSGDIITVYAALQKASKDNHLPAFQRCAN